jgi:hypothetical protein
MPRQTVSEVALTGRFLIGVTILVLIGLSAALLLGFFLGGGRALYRIARGKPVSSVFEEEFIRLNLQVEWVEPSPTIHTPHPKG